jgi:hypothetical protein
MLKRTAALLAALAVTVTAALTAGSASAAPATPRLASATLASTIALDDCSASLVRYPSSLGSDRALMLTAGHCWEGTMPAAGQVLQNLSSSRSGTLLNASGSSIGSVRADKLLYATMTSTDIAVYELTETFAAITSRTGAAPLTISASHPTSTEAVSIPSGYWNRIWSCRLNGFAATVREDQWTWHDSLRYDTAGGCEIIGGSSGSPVEDTATGAVIGVNNTINDNGQMCTLDNPCEVASDGTTTATQGQGYGQELYWVTTCLNSANAIDLSVSGCLLPKPPGSGNTVTVDNPGAQTVAQNGTVHLQITGHDSDSSQTLTYTATGLPAGLSISSSGLISGTATTAGSSQVTVKATDGTNASGSTTFTFTVTSASGGGVTNGGFETGSLSGWTSAGSTGVTGSGTHSGGYAAMVGSTSPSATSSITQTFTAPAGSGTLAFWYDVTCPDTVTYDWATATLKDNTTGTTSTVLAKTCTQGAGWKQVTTAVTAGHSYTLTLVSKDDGYAGDATYTLYDDVTVS